MAKEKDAEKKEKKGFLSALLSRIRPEKKTDAPKEQEAKKGGSGGTF